MLRGGVEKKDAGLERKDAVLRGEVEKKDAVLRGEIEKKDVMRGKFEIDRGNGKEGCVAGGEVDRRILDLLMRGDYDRARIL